MGTPPRPELKKELYRLVVARSDITAALSACKLMLEMVDKLGHDLYPHLFHAIVIAYVRPFTRNKPVGRLSSEWSKFKIDKHQKIHDEIIEARNKFVAHSDEEIRRVDIYPP